MKRKLTLIIAIVLTMAMAAGILAACGGGDSFTITYKPGTNGSGTVAEGTKTKGEDFTLSSQTFTRDGYIQTGWSTKDGGAKEYELGGKYTKDAKITLYPFWTESGSSGGAFSLSSLPTNVKIQYTLSTGFSTTVSTIIKIGNDFYFQDEMDGMLLSAYFLRHSNGTWTEYSKSFFFNSWDENDVYNSAQELTAELIDNVHYFSVLVNPSALLGIQDVTAAGTQSLLGVTTNKFTATTSSDEVTYWKDPATSLIFKYEVGTSTNEITLWNKAVSSFDGYDIP
ncbi:MAG: InlB B-repeat-containing protein [Clostridiales bacterium]|nr:InlB B-repeat-containing protein [Clostridiales bacterium]